MSEYYNLSKAEAAKYIGKSERSLERYVRQGKLQTMTLPRKGGGYEVRYASVELDRLIEQTSIPRITATVDSLSAPNDTPRHESAEIDLVEVAYAIAAKLVEAIVLARQQSPLSVYRELEEAAEKHWILPTSKVVELIGVSPRRKVFVRGSFQFVRCGKVGSESGWLVEYIKTEQ